MVNQASWGIVGSYCRRLEHIKWKLAFNDKALIATLQKPPWWHTEVLLGENSPTAFGLFWGYSLSVFYLCDIYGPRGKGDDEWLEIPHLATPTIQLQLTLPSLCRSFRCCHSAFLNREHMFNLRTSNG